MAIKPDAPKPIDTSPAGHIVMGLLCFVAAGYFFYQWSTPPPEYRQPFVLLLPLTLAALGVMYVKFALPKLGKSAELSELKTPDALPVPEISRDVDANRPVILPTQARGWAAAFASVIMVILLYFAYIALVYPVMAILSLLFACVIGYGVIILTCGTLVSNGVQVALVSEPLVPGQRGQVQLTAVGPANAANYRVVLTCREHASAGYGRSERNYYEFLHQTELYSGHIGTRSLDFELPTDAPFSFSASNNQLEWSFHVVPLKPWPAPAEAYYVFRVVPPAVLTPKASTNA